MCFISPLRGVCSGISLFKNDNFLSKEEAGFLIVSTGQPSLDIIFIV